MICTISGAYLSNMFTEKNIECCTIISSLFAIGTSGLWNHTTYYAIYRICLRLLLCLNKMHANTQKAIILLEEFVLVHSIEFFTSDEDLGSRIQMAPPKYFISSTFHIIITNSTTRVKLNIILERN